MSFNNEEWKPAFGYEGFYEVSNLGRVRSVAHYDANKHFRPSKVIKIGTRPNGYKLVHLSKNGETKYVSVHRLVAYAFVDKPDGCDVVNHIDNEPANNRADNLEWTTLKGNMQWATRQGRMGWRPENQEKAAKARRRPVVATNENGEEFAFESQADAARKLNLSKAMTRHIAAACRGDYGYKTVGGYKWRYKDE